MNQKPVEYVTGLKFLIKLQFNQIDCWFDVLLLELVRF